MLEPNNLNYDFDSFMRNEAPIQQLRRYIVAEVDDVAAMALATRIAREFRDRLTVGIVVASK